jgi:hypothetical protein
MEDSSRPPPLPHDVNFEITSSGYEIWFSDRISNDHPDLVDQCGEWMEVEVGALNLGQIDHRVLMADGLLTDDIRNRLLAWWNERVGDLEQN